MGINEFSGMGADLTAAQVWLNRDHFDSLWGPCPSIAAQEGPMTH